MVATNRPFQSTQEIASLIDHTLLKPEATERDLLAACQQALEHNFAALCVNPCRVPLVQAQLKNSKVKTCCVAGFPLGANRTAAKLQEAQIALHEGASEIDMVINIGALRSGDRTLVAHEIQELAGAAHRASGILKVILETCLLTEKEKMIACRLAKDAGADFVKTSTGFSTGGATEADVRLMRSAVGAELGVKASGGVRTLQALTAMIDAGANRIGTSSGVQILAEFASGLQTADVAAGSTY